MVLRIDVALADVQEVYDGPVGKLWELLMGEEIHVGGAEETDVLAQKATIGPRDDVLDVCSALGGPARHLALKFGCNVTGLDATTTMHSEAVRRTDAAHLADQVRFCLGDALAMPFDDESFDVVWGQDAWCYVTDKERLIHECYRVLRPGGTIAFTDWLNKRESSDEQQKGLLAFMVFPYMETLDGYENLLEKAGFMIVEKQDLTADFASHMHVYQRTIKDLKNTISRDFGAAMYAAAEHGINLWVEAADTEKVGRGRLIGRKAPAPGVRH